MLQNHNQIKSKKRVAEHGEVFTAESALALKLIGLKTGDDLKFGNGFTKIDVNNN